MALTEAREAFVGLLAKPNGWQAEYREDLASKNLLATGEVSPGDVCEILKACKESEYTFYPHLDDARTMVHDFRPKWNGSRWIVKCYLLTGQAMFISVHPMK